MEQQYIYVYSGNEKHIYICIGYIGKKKNDETATVVYYMWRERKKNKQTQHNKAQLQHTFESH